MQLGRYAKGQPTQWFELENVLFILRAAFIFSGMILLIYVVHHRKDRMQEQHARSGITHHLADLFPHFGLIAMSRTLGAGGLVLLKRTFIYTLHGIGI
jgi:hypothetical protein